MYIKLIRGAKQIGGNIVEIGTDNTRLIFDAGTNLPPIDDRNYIDDISVEGLTCGKAGYNAVFISHHHGDHCGLVSRIVEEIPVYCGKETSEILEVIGDFIHSPLRCKFSIFSDRETVQCGDIKVTPILTKHSARDAYMFFIEADGKTVLYTGDFNDYSSTAEYISDKHVNVLITEGTNINTAERGYMPEIKDENDVRIKAEEICNEYDGTVFVLCSSANEERVLAMKEAAANTGRTDYEDLFMASLRRQDDEKYKFIASFVKDDNVKEKYFNYFYSKRQLVGAEKLASTKGKKLLFVRQSMAPFISKYLSSLPERERNQRHVLIYSIWNGYKRSAYTKHFLKEMSKLNIDVVDLHCSGHAYGDTIMQFVKTVSPDVLIPIHCEESDREIFNSVEPNCYLSEDNEVYVV